MVVTRVDIIEENGEITPAIYIRSNNRKFHLFVDKNQNVRTHVNEYRFRSETPILKI